MDAPRGSILIPAYNERFFGEAFDSALAQAGADIEIVVCDDSPGDAIGKRVKSANDPRVRYVRNDPARGFEGNFTFALAQARGELVKFLNDDDRLRPGCVAQLSAVFDDPGIRLATSRRIVIDDAGAQQPDMPATTPVSHASCVIEGIEMGDLVLVNGLNLVGEPTTAMFRRGDIEPEAAGLFTWNGKSYHCLADLALWLRLMAKGAVFYCATALSEYRVHRGQEQRRGLGLDCITERIDIVHAARGAGYLARAGQPEAALMRIDALARMWRQNPRVSAAQAVELDGVLSTVASELARLG
ncbi:MAG TPA: glycosyltransferase family 2 protein [Usitatibacter sp.]|nr:glycosyltransferase family 2 protein [Usitatibacter sp.]